MSSLRYWVWLASRKIYKTQSVFALLEAFEKPERIYFAAEEEYDRVPGLTPRDKAALLDKRMGDVARAIEICQENDWRILTIHDAAYPERLRNIYDAPIVLYARGKLTDLDSEAVVSVVGTRKCTPYGIKAAERIGYDLAQAGCVVATGMARGIDSAAARGALRGGGKVIGVAASGLDVIYPPENRSLFDDVAAEGVILTEHMPGVGVTKYAFPRRNRIMSGLALGVAVIEAPERSGALITADWALEQGRDVFAVPGNIDAESCAGSNKLLRDGAEIILSGWDIAEAYRPLYSEKIRSADEVTDVPLDPKALHKLIENETPDPKKSESAPEKDVDIAESKEYIDVVVSKEDLSETEWKVISALQGAELQVDDLILSSGLPAARVLSTLTVLEIKGLVRQLPGKRFTLNASVK